MQVARFGAAGTLSWLDRRLIDPGTNGQLAGPVRFVVEFLYFGAKEARACLFAGLFFAAVFLMPRSAATSSRHGACSTFVSGITRPIGWRQRSPSRFT